MEIYREDLVIKKPDDKLTSTENTVELQLNGDGIIENVFACSSEKKENNLDSIAKFLDSSFDKIKLLFLKEFKDVQAFYNLDINQKDFNHKVLELVRNSLDNFMQQSIKDGVITITFNFSKNNINCKVKDNGTGIYEEQDKLFLNNFESKKQMGKHFGGRGLGLSQLKEWVIKEGGNIGYSSLKKGSEFTLSVDPHRHAYDFPGMEEALASPERARETIIKHYLDQLKKLSKELSKNSSSSLDNLKEYVDGWLSVDEHSLPYPMFIFQASILQEEFTKFKESR